MSEAAVFPLEANPRGVVGCREEGGPGGSALGVGVVVVIVKITSTMIKPPRDGIDQPGRVNLADAVHDAELWEVASGNLAPAFIVDDPCHDRRVSLELRHHEVGLPLEFRLVFGGRIPGSTFS